MKRAVLAAAIALSGCSLGSDEETRPEPARGAAQGVADTVRALERATRAGDWRAVCERLFTAVARRRAGGADCPRLVRSAAGRVRAPRIELLSIELQRGAAEARVQSRARGQQPLTDTIRLRPERGRWRIESLR